MFVHAGAGLHGHEYSPPKNTHSSSQQQAPGTVPQPPSRPLPLLRSALRPLSDITDPSFTTDSLDNTDAHDNAPLAGWRSFSDSLYTFPLLRRPTSDIVSKKDLAVRFQETPMASIAPSITTLPSDDDESIAGSDFSGYTDTTARRKRRKRAPRKTTHYALAHPAPQLRTKQRRLVQIRPRLLLQLQQVNDHRPIPTFDVLPSSTVCGSLIIPKLDKRFPRIFRAKPDLGPDDLLFVQSEDYRAGPTAEDGGEEGIGDRDLMAVVGPMLCDDNNAEIVMGDGSVWTTSHMYNGSYEFTRVDGSGITTTARWVRKSARRAKRASDSTDASPRSSPGLPENRWTFSIIDPSTRRHPIMGVLTPQELVVYDSYSTMSSSSGRYPPTRPFSPTLSILSDDAASSETTPTPAPTRDERLTETVPEEYRKLMAVTASWISLRLADWPASFRPKLGRASTNGRSGSNHNNYTDRRRTFPFSGTLSPHINSGTPRTSSEKDAPRTPPSEATAPERRKSTGANFTRRRQPELETTRGNVDDIRPVHAPEQARSPPPTEDEKTHTCRIKVRKWAQKLFHRKKSKAR